MKNLFELATGETLTLESLRYYLGTLAECGRLKVDSQQAGLVRSVGVMTSPYLLLSGLGENIDRLQHALYNARLAKGKTMQERKAEADKALAWFIYNLKDEMGAQLHPALNVLGLSVEDFMGLIKDQLRYDAATLADVFGEAKQVTAAFKVIGSADKLYRDNVIEPLTQEDIDLAWAWVQRFTNAAFTATTNRPREAFRCAEERANWMALRADWFARGDADLLKYALEQLEMDVRIKL